jgi:hypothetical protein
MGPPFDKYRSGSKWHRLTNRNEVQDRTILRRWPEVAAELARLRALPGVAQAETACRAWFAERARRIPPTPGTKGAAA